jgi:hypothetical protein
MYCSEPNKFEKKMAHMQAPSYVHRRRHIFSDSKHHNSSSKEEDSKKRLKGI